MGDKGLEPITEKSIEVAVEDLRTVVSKCCTDVANERDSLNFDIARLEKSVYELIKLTTALKSSVDAACESMKELASEMNMLKQENSEIKQGLKSVLNNLHHIISQPPSTSGRIKPAITPLCQKSATNCILEEEAQDKTPLQREPNEEIKSKVEELRIKVDEMTKSVNITALAEKPKTQSFVQKSQKLILTIGSDTMEHLNPNLTITPNECSHSRIVGARLDQKSGSITTMKSSIPTMIELVRELEPAVNMLKKENNELKQELNSVSNDLYQSRSQPSSPSGRTEPTLNSLFQKSATDCILERKAQDKMLSQGGPHEEVMRNDEQLRIKADEMTISVNLTALSEEPKTQSVAQKSTQKRIPTLEPIVIEILKLALDLTISPSDYSHRRIVGTKLVSYLTKQGKVTKYYISLAESIATGKVTHEEYIKLLKILALIL